jgi:hypothetical protein
LARKDRIHVTKKGDHWQAKREGAGRASATGKTQGAVEKRAKEIGDNSGGAQVIIHRPKGPIRDADTTRRGNESSWKDTKH